MFSKLSLPVLAAASVFAAALTPAQAIEIRKEQQLYMVTPAMMAAINTIVREEMKMRRRHMNHK